MPIPTIKGPEWYSNDPRVSQAVWDKYFRDKYNSNLQVLQHVTASSYVAAFEATFQMLKRSPTARPLKPSLTESQLMHSYNHQCRAPIISCLVFAAFTVESMIDLVAAVTYKACSRDSSELAGKFEKFDGKGFSKRLRCALSLAGEKQVGCHFVAEIEALIKFRDRCAHDVPEINGPKGELKRCAPPRASEQSPTVEVRPYPALDEKWTTLSIREARRAITAADSLWNHFASQASETFYDSVREHSLIWPEHSIGHLASQNASMNDLPEFESLLYEWDLAVELYEDCFSEDRDLNVQLVQKTFQIVKP